MFPFHTNMYLHGMADKKTHVQVCKEHDLEHLSFTHKSTSRLQTLGHDATIESLIINKCK